MLTFEFDVMSTTATSTAVAQQEQMAKTLLDHNNMMEHMEFIHQAYDRCAKLQMNDRREEFVQEYLLANSRYMDPNEQAQLSYKRIIDEFVAYYELKLIRLMEV